ncbi:uncharacterized protein LOC112351227 [Selaginella moellendorffii]|uniref:uncharacterized protein LOC112351227 n=1 Tax=Selaginella moellendorffii TaxID=88036 RepID=UPI000D1C9978|nr:uncharacterized protein LOC112351227 [Selaginella moellendorffii]|eukprot:XP_024544456.1 uncharacterized protein LOC112351227 [Selaginella moellendorffii]
MESPGIAELDLPDDDDTLAPEEEEAQEQRPADDLEVEIVQQRIVFIIPALPPRPEIHKNRRKEKRQRQRDRDRGQNPEQLQERQRERKRQRKEIIVPSINPGALARLLAPGQEENLIHRTKTLFLRKRVERRGGLRLWLGSKGLGRFARLFQEHKIDVSELSHLTMDALKQIGVLPVGPRRKLIAAIEKLCI